MIRILLNQIPTQIDTGNKRQKLPPTLIFADTNEKSLTKPPTPWYNDCACKRTGRIKIRREHRATDVGLIPEKREMTG